MKDERPPQSEMPDDSRRIVCDLLKKVQADITAAFDQVAAMPGNPAERQNDALSVIAQVGAAAGAMLIARMMLLKGVPHPVAWMVAQRDIQTRMMMIFDEAEMAARATRQ